MHKLQLVRISRLLNDPSDDLEPEDRELLIAQVLDLEWPKEMANLKRFYISLNHREM